MDAKGPFVSLVMGVVVLKDVVVIVAFALTMELVPMVRGRGPRQGGSVWVWVWVGVSGGGEAAVGLLVCGTTLSPHQHQ